MILLSFEFSNFSSVAQSCLTLCDPMDCSMPGFPVHHQIPGFTQPHVHRVSDAIQPSHPLPSPSPPAFNHSPLLLLPSIISSIRVFSNSHFSASGGQSIGVSASASAFYISLSNEYSGLISFRMDRLDLLAVQGTLKSLLQYHSSKAQLFGGQLSL